MRNSIYVDFAIERVVEFKTIFPYCRIPSISKCITGFSRKALFGAFLANLVNKVVNKPFYNPDYRGDERDIDTLRFFLSGNNIKLIRRSIKLLQKTASKEHIEIKNYIGATEESALYLLREMMAINTEGARGSDKKTEISFYKALLIANTLTINKVKYDKTFTGDDKELYFATAFSSQLGSSDFLYQNRQLLLLSQTVKCIRFFEYAINDTVLNPLVKDFCDLYGIRAWWIYPKAIWTVYALTRGRAGIIRIDREMDEETEQCYSVIERSSIPYDLVIPKQDNNDYAIFREYPLIKIEKNEFVFINYQFLVERIFNGLYFVFRNLAEQRGISQSDFRRVYSTEFSERVLFCGVLSQALRTHFDVLMTECDCLAVDKSKDAKSASPPDFYVRSGDIVLLFENKDILMSKELKEKGSQSDYIDFLRTRLYRSDNGSPKGVMQLMNLVKKIRSGEFQRRWDPNCPKDSVVYPVLVVPDVKFTLQGVKNILQRWQVETGVSMDNVKPIAYTDLGTLCLYQHEFANKGIMSYLNDYYEQSSFSRYETCEDINELPNTMMSFTDYLVHTHNDSLTFFRDEWAEYIKKPSS